MESQRERLVVVLAGYRDRMDDFFALNPGMASRIAHHVDFPDYTADELLAIGRLMVGEASYELSPGAEDALRRQLERRAGGPGFAHARSVRNLVEAARLRHANRIYELVRAGTPATTRELIRLEAEDIA